MGSCKPSLAAPLVLFLGTAGPAFGSHDSEENPCAPAHRSTPRIALRATAQTGRVWQRSEPDGTLRAPPHDNSGHTWHHRDQLLVDYVTLGGAETLQRLGVTGVKNGMPAFGDVLSEEETEAVLD